MRIENLFEDENKSVAFSFGRMNPPTIGHGQVFDTLANVNKDYRIFVSPAQTPKKDNPLDFSTKVKFIKAMFPAHSSHVSDDPSLNTIMKVAVTLYQQGYKNVTIVAGSDRLENFKKLLDQYNGIESAHGIYKFENIDYVSSGDRDPDADGLEGISASAAREAARQNDVKKFANVTGAGKYADELYKAVRAGLNIKESEMFTDLSLDYKKFINEAPIELDPAEPMNPMIYGAGGNPAKLQYRMARAAGQLKDLAARAASASPSEWQMISKHFEELTMNINQIKHGLEELAKQRRKGGVRSRGIDTMIDSIEESITNLGSQFHQAQYVKQKGKEMRAKEIEPTKPRNFVAKNAKMGGAGAHKDKKKAAKQGDTKHKNKEVSEASQAYRDAMAKSREAEINYRADNAEKRLAKKAAEPKNLRQKIAKDIGGPLKKLAKGDIKGALGVNEGTSYGQMGPELAQKLLSAYKETSQGVEQYRDQEGAARIYNELKQVASENNGGQYLRSLMNSASHSAHMDFDTNPGDFKNWFTYVGDHLEGLVNVMKEKGLITDEPDTLPDEEKMSERFRDPEDWDEGNTEPPNNFAVYINGKKWKVFKGRGTYADDYREQQHYQQLRAWADKKSAATGKKWSVHTTGEPATE